MGTAHGSKIRDYSVCTRACAHSPRPLAAHKLTGLNTQPHPWEHRTCLAGVPTVPGESQTRSCALRRGSALLVYAVCPEGIQPCNIKNKDIYWRRHKIQETLYIGQWHLTPLQSRHLGTSQSSSTIFHCSKHFAKSLVGISISCPIVHIYLYRLV